MLSAAEVLEAAIAEPITLDQVKTFLRIDGNALDAELELMLVAAREDLELLTGLRLVDQVVRVVARCPADLEHLTVGPVRELVAIGTRAPGGDLAPEPVDAFEVTGADLDRGIAPIGSWPASTRSRPIVVDLRVGYGVDATSVPASLRLALLALMRGRYDERPADVERLVTNYRINA